MSEVMCGIPQKEVEKMYKLAQEGLSPRVYFCEDLEKMRKESSKIQSQNIGMIFAMLRTILQKD